MRFVTIIFLLSRFLGFKCTDTTFKKHNADRDRIAMQEEIYLSKLLSAMNVTTISRTIKQPEKNYSIESLKKFVNSFQSIPYIYEREDFLGFDATKLFKRSLRKNKSIELNNLRSDYKHQYAFVEVHQTIKDEEVVRWKRSQDGSCSLQSITVNLTDIGWDMVISPSQLQYRYCSGECNVRDIPARMFLKSHGQIRYKLEREGTISLPPSCCSPSHYDPVIMLYLDGYDEDGRQIIRRGVFEETLASSCGCG